MIAMVVMLEEVKAEIGEVNVDFLHHLQARFEANLVKPEGALQQCQAELGCWAAFLQAKAAIEELTSKPTANCLFCIPGWLGVLCPFLMGDTHIYFSE